MTVGTLESNDVVVDADGVSRVHAVFERFGDAWCVRDLGSRNGTLVNGGRVIGERALHSGDEIVLGRLRLLFHGPGRGQGGGGDGDPVAGGGGLPATVPAALPAGARRPPAALRGERPGLEVGYEPLEVV